MDPLSLLSRRAASVPSPRRHTVRYAGVLASASKLRPRLAPKKEAPEGGKGESKCSHGRGRGTYWPWADLLKRTFAVDILSCPRCGGRLRLVAVVTEPVNVERYLAGVGEASEAPSRAPARGPPYWKSRVLRRGALGEEAASFSGRVDGAKGKVHLRPRATGYGKLCAGLGRVMGERKGPGRLRGRGPGPPGLAGKSPLIRLRSRPPTRRLPGTSGSGPGRRSARRRSW